MTRAGGACLLADGLELRPQLRLDVVEDVAEHVGRDVQHLRVVVLECHLVVQPCVLRQVAVRQRLCTHTGQMVRQKSHTCVLSEMAVGVCLFRAEHRRHLRHKAANRCDNAGQCKR